MVYKSNIPTWEPLQSATINFIENSHHLYYQLNTSSQTNMGINRFIP